MPPIRLDLAHHHLCHSQLVHTTLTLGKSWFQVGKGREIFKKYFKCTGHEAPSAFLLTELLFFFFSVIYWLPKFDERPL